MEIGLNIKLKGYVEICDFYVFILINVNIFIILFYKVFLFIEI